MSKYSHLYKNSGYLKEQQSLRRTRLLEDQRRKRENHIDEQRLLHDAISPPSKAIQAKGLRRNKDYCRNLMLSEWMLEVPDDIDSFFLVPCPKGIRCTIVANGARRPAEVYYKNGQLLMNLNTNLPVHTVLDCVYNKLNKTFYILDMIMYGNLDMTDCETQFRFFWIKSKFADDELRIIDDGFKLELLKAYDFSDTLSVSNCFKKFAAWNDAELDGYLFYHKETSYQAGESPAVLWLFPFMIDELFDKYDINPIYHHQKPADYTNYLEFILKFEEKRNNKKNISRHRSMEHEDSPEQSTDPQTTLQEMIDLEYGNSA